MQATRKQEAYVLVRAEEKAPSLERKATQVPSQVFLTSADDEKIEDPKKTLRLLLPASLSGKMKRFETRICYGGTLQTNSGVSYLGQWNVAGGSSGQGTLPWSQVGSAAEFSALDQIFDEFFIRGATLRYVPHNRHSAQGPASYNAATAAGAPGYMNSCMGVVVFLPHLGATFSSAATSYVAMRSAEQSKVFNTGDPFVFKVKNTEKFSWDAPLGDQTTSAATMGWCDIAHSTGYGGRFQFATAQSSGASVGAGTFPESALFGDWLLELDVAFRARA